MILRPESTVLRKRSILSTSIQALKMHLQCMVQLALRGHTEFHAVQSLMLLNRVLLYFTCNHVVWQVALEACKEAAGSLEEVHFVLFSNNMYKVWQEEASRTLRAIG